MPRHNHPRRRSGPTSAAAARGVGAEGFGARGFGARGFGAGTRSESGPDGEWAVRPVPASGAGKIYRCPGCDHTIAAGVAHVVAWRTDDPGGVEDRRHWHNGCWAGRGRRGLTRRWS
ncbi:ATP/GTP-binding protein [Rhodococcus sp. X156]|uniref:ATP/GTP-binding protein n=1 Tax=Rhodococcus sp. X156 TaxID=2499145 RepID=UPI000FD90A4C|nr:ATP/GTP-binding protein [Rhodococcus sp. X156]